MDNAAHCLSPPDILPHSLLSPLFPPLTSPSVYDPQNSISHTLTNLISPLFLPILSLCALL